MPSLLICGTGGHAKVVADLARCAGWNVAGFLDDLHPERAGNDFCGARILSPEELPADLELSVTVAVGECSARLRRTREFLAQGWPVPRLVHPRAVVAESAIIGPGSQMAAGAVINPDARLGMGVLVNTAATVDHDCIIEDGVHLAPGVHLAGDVRIGEGTFIGIGTVARQGVRVGRGCVVGAGSVIVRDLPDGSTAYGVPARVKRTA